MQQVYHSNARTNLNIRYQLQNIPENNSELASRFNISKQTVSKWKNRDFLQDSCCKPLNIQYALTDLEKALVISLRTSSWVSIDEVWENLLEINSKISRSSVYRCFVKEKINQIPQEKKDKAKKFKEYEPGFLHIDVTYLPKFKGKSNYLFVAIDRCTRAMIYWVYENKTAENTQDFIDKCIAFFPFNITHILTDNGLEFTNRLLKSKTGNSCQKLSKMDIKCIENSIQHRLTAPFTPKTNGMVERVNGIIKNNTVLKIQYQSLDEMKNDLTKFLWFYNLNRRHGSIRKELKVKTPFNAIEKWYQLKPEIFKITPNEFKNNRLTYIKNNYLYSKYSDMESIFTGENVLEFIKTFPDDETCRIFIANEKWKDGYKCKRCDNTKYIAFKKHNTRECTKCRYKESATAGTLFHKVKFGIQKAFCIAFEMTCTTKGLSTTQAAKRYGVTQKTSWLFMQKVRLAMKSSKQFPMVGNVQVDEFVIGGKETGKQGRSYDSKKVKVVCAIELTDDGKIKRGYADIIDDYSAISIKSIFEKHISKEAKIKTDKWTAYSKISKEYNIVQEKSIPGKNFKEMHTIIHQIKTGIRTIQTHVKKNHLQKYLDEYFYRLNRSIFKDSIFDNIFKRLVAHPHCGWNQIVVIK